MNQSNAAVSNGQTAAIKHGEGPALVVAGPGSGKTYVITKRLEYLINTCHIDPSNILTITFTNAAAKEMRSRAYSLIGGGVAGVTVGTFHSVFYSILKEAFSLNASNILRPQDKYILLCDIARKLDIVEADMATVCDGISALISRKKNGLESPGIFGSDIDEKILSLYSGKLKELRLIDFDDMIIKCRNLLEKDPVWLDKIRNRFLYIMVDEYQDTNPVQYEALKLIAGNKANILTVGDDDQSIYGFRGAGFAVLKRFIDDYPQAEVYELCVNYRCRAAIADAADKVIELNSGRIEKHHTSFDQTGDEVDIRKFKDRTEEVKAIKAELDSLHPDDSCLLVRTNELAAYFADELDRSGVPVRLRGRRKCLYDTDIGKDVIAYLRLASGIYEREDLLRVMNKPMRFLSREALGSENAGIQDVIDYYKGTGNAYGKAVCLAEDIQQMGHMSPRAAIRYLMKVVGYEKYIKNEGRDTEKLYALYQRSADYSSIRQWLCSIEEEKACKDQKAEICAGDRSALNVMTIHASKGLEFAEVFIADVNDGIIPYHKAASPEGIEEERRLLYVGMTRAVKKLHLFFIEESMGKPLMPSPFLNAIKKTR